MNHCPKLRLINHQMQSNAFHSRQGTIRSDMRIVIGYCSQIASGRPCIRSGRELSWRRAVGFNSSVGPRRWIDQHHNHLDEMVRQSPAHVWNLLYMTRRHRIRPTQPRCLQSCPPDQTDLQPEEKVQLAAKPALPQRRRWRYPAVPPTLPLSAHGTPD